MRVRHLCTLCIQFTASAVQSSRSHGDDRGAIVALTQEGRTRIPFAVAADNNIINSATDYPKIFQLLDD